jgi:hypothetical protein
MKEQSQGACHGTVYFDEKKRQFIQVRETYFQPSQVDQDRILHTGHFCIFLGDAKNNIPSPEIRGRDIKNLINVEEVGLLELERRGLVTYGYGTLNDWRGMEKSHCPCCGKERD